MESGLLQRCHGWECRRRRSEKATGRRSCKGTMAARPRVASMVRYRSVMDESQPTRNSLRDALRDCVLETCASTRARSAGQQSPLEEKQIWERAADGSFRPRRIVVPYAPILFLKFGPNVKELDSFRRAMEVAQADPIAGPQINALVGAEGLGAFRLDGERLVGSLAAAMVRDDGQIEFDEGLFGAKWEEIARDLYANDLTRITVAPLPRLVAPYPIKLTDGVELDRLTDEEVALCADLRLLGTFFPGFEFVNAEEAVGLRCTTSVRKIVGESLDATQLAQGGEFGRRPAWAQHLLVDDVLTTLRLVKEGRVRTTGQVSTIKGWMLGGMRQYSPRGWAPLNVAQYELDEIETTDLQGLWAQLSSGVLEERRFLAASLRRFNLALDRDLMEDRIVDLMIAGESLFLHDVGRPQDRGESRFRLALRAAAFAESTQYTKRQAFRVMREGYDVRSQIVHGGTVARCRLPDKAEANVSELATAVEGIMRAGLRKGLVTPALTQEGFWESLLLPPEEPA